jgi:hypothetical protein
MNLYLITTHGTYSIKLNNRMAMNNELVRKWNRMAIAYLSYKRLPGGKGKGALTRHEEYTVLGGTEVRYTHSEPRY